MKTIKIICLIFFCCLLTAADLERIVDAEDNKEELIRIGYIDYSGFIEQDDNNHYTGYAVDYLEKVAEYTGWSYEYVHDTWENLLLQLEQGEIDFLLSAQFTPERAERFLYSDYTLGVEYNYLYTWPGNDSLYYNDYEAMTGLRCGLMRKSYQTDVFLNFMEKSIGGMEVSYYATDSEMMNALLEKEIDLIAGGSLSEHKELKRVGTFGSAPFYAISGLHNNEKMEQLNKALGELQEIYPALQYQLRGKYYMSTLAASEPLFNREEEEYRDNCSILKVGVPADEYPLSYYDFETENCEGIFADFLDVLSVNSGLQFEIVPLDGENDGEYDLLFGQFSENGTEEFYVSASCLSTYSVGVCRSGEEVDVDGALTVAAAASNLMLEDYLNEHYPHYRIIYYANTEKCLDAVKNREADITIQNKFIITYQLQKPEYVQLSIMPIYSIQEDISFQMDRTADRLLKNVLNKAVLTIDEYQQEQIKMDNTVTAGYSMTTGDFLKKNALEIAIFLLLFFALAILMAYVSRRQTERRLLQQEADHLRNLAENDLLTGLYNRQMFYQKVRRMMEHLQEDYDILSMNMEGFKVINELYGTKQGDDILIYLAEGLRKILKKIPGVGSRLNADNFVLCIPSSQDSEELAASLQDYISDYSEEMHMSLRFGVYHITERDMDVSAMCDRANLACDSIRNNYHVKRAVYTDIHKEKLLREQTILNEMEKALAQGEFQMYLQPKNNLEDGSIIGSEALVRWISPDRGIISPGEFIPIFEKNGFVTRLDYYIWEQACIFLKYCREHNLPMLPVSVNVSRLNFYNFHLEEILVKLVNKYQLEPNYLELEVTESAYTDNEKRMIEIQTSLQKRGFRFLMDDFGSGYSSLNTLKNLPVDVLKLDLRFLQDEEKMNGRGEIILQSVISMAKELQLPVIAEGIETEAQLMELREMGCQTGQGFYFSRPVPVPEFIKLMTGRRRN